MLAAPRTTNAGARIQTQWETCHTTGEQCLLDFTNPNNRGAVDSSRCALGSVPKYFIDVRNHKQVQEAFHFSRNTGIPIVIDNTGHDYKGRSSGPGTLALWTHNLQDISLDDAFVAEGCPASYQAVTMGAGVQFSKLYAFAEANNVTVVGGSDASVGASGGWLMGGGHGALSNTLGLGVDRVLQFKIVTPDGKYRTANACQNKDLFFALRGGGGGTFGVVLETTIKASPQVTLQAVFLTFSGTIEHTKELWSVMIDNGLKWAEEGWGGYSTFGAFIYITPLLTPCEADESMKPIAQLGERLKAQGATNVSLVQAQFDSWLQWYSVFSKANKAMSGVSLPLASRLINKGSFKTEESREALLEALVAAYHVTPRMILLATAPASFAGDGQTSVTEAWRDSIYHITAVSSWQWNATKVDKLAGYKRVSQSIDNLRKITPDAAYSNECDVYEPNHEETLWGSNYRKLLAVKRKYDPDHLLDCWHCVGWDKNSPRFRCYFSEEELQA